jgi:hypothetical protein
MWEISEGEPVRYRCHVGHAYTAEIMSLAFRRKSQASPFPERCERPTRALPSPGS